MRSVATLLGSAALESPLCKMQRGSRKELKKKATIVILSRRNCGLCQLTGMSFTNVWGHCSGSKVVICRRRRHVSNERPTHNFIRTKDEEATARTGGLMVEGRPQTWPRNQWDGATARAESNQFCSCPARLSNPLHGHPGPPTSLRCSIEVDSIIVLFSPPKEGSTHHASTYSQLVHVQPNPFCQLLAVGQTRLSPSNHGTLGAIILCFNLI